MPRLIHRRTTTIADLSPAMAACLDQAGTTDTQPDSQPASNSDDMEVLGGNTCFSRNRPHQRFTSTRAQADWQRLVPLAARSVQKNDRAKRPKSMGSAHWAEERSDDSASSDSDGSSSAVEDEDDSSLTSSEDSESDYDSETEHDSLESDSEKDDQSTSEVDEDRDTSEVEDIPVKRKSSHTRFAPVRSSAGPDDRQSEVNRLDDCRPAKSQCATTREVIYIRVSHATSADAQRNLLRRLRKEYPGTLIVLDESPFKTPFADRTSFGLLWQRIQDGCVDCVWIPRMSHISKSKEAFQLFEWMCDEHRVPILLQPALELAIKASRTNI